MNRYGTGGSDRYQGVTAANETVIKDKIRGIRVADHHLRQ